MPQIIKAINAKKNTPLIILALVVLAGVFLRAYNFHDWLRFNPDQARDATVISSVISGERPLPLLGPKAGGTEFRLGPAFYYFQYLSAKIFGDYPDKMAYPDLFFSILSIPLLFFLLKKYFNPKVSLALTAIYSFSFYAVRYSRFAWNPNSTPFWTMLFLYALLEIFTPEAKRKVFWSVAAGVAVGIGMQLHTFLLVVLPLLVIIAFVHLVVKDKKILKYFLIVFLVSIFLNIPQLKNEFRTGGGNVKAFFEGMNIKKEKNSIPEKIIQAGKCYIVADVYIISSMGGSDSCAVNSEKSGSGLILVILAILFSLGGVILAIRNCIMEPDEAKKRFTGLFLAYAWLLLLLMVPVAYEVSMRYFLILIFMPFIFLGFWIEFLTENSKFKNIALAIISVLLIATNIISIQKDFAALSSPKSSGNVDVVYLGEMEKVSSYIVANSGEQKEVFLDGNNLYLFKSVKSIAYLAGKAEIKVTQMDRKDAPVGQILFYLGNAKIKRSSLDELRQGYEVLDSQTFGRFSVLKLRKK